MLTLCSVLRAVWAATIWFPVKTRVPNRKHVPICFQSLCKYYSVYGDILGKRPLPLWLEVLWLLRHSSLQKFSNSKNSWDVKSKRTCPEKMSLDRWNQDQNDEKRKSQRRKQTAHDPKRNALSVKHGGSNVRALPCMDVSCVRLTSSYWRWAAVKAEQSISREETYFCTNLWEETLDLREVRKQLSITFSQ